MIIEKATISKEKKNTSMQSILATNEKNAPVREENVLLQRNGNSKVKWNAHE